MKKQLFISAILSVFLAGFIVVSADTTKESYFDTVFSLVEKIKDPGVRIDELVKIAGTYRYLNQKEKAGETLEKAQRQCRFLSDNPPGETDSSQKIGLEYGKMGNRTKAIELLDIAVKEGKNIRGACDQGTFQSFVYRDIANDFFDLGDHNRAIATAQKSGDQALNEIIGRYLVLNDLIHAEQANKLVTDQENKESNTADVYLKKLHLANFDTTLQRLNSIKSEPVKIRSLEKLAVQYYHLKGHDGEKVAALLADLVKKAGKIKEKFTRDELLAEISGNYAEVRQFEKGKALARKIEWEGSRATGLVRIAYAYGKINFKKSAADLLKEASKVAGRLEPGLDLEELDEMITKAYYEIGLLDNNHQEAKYDVDILYLVALRYCEKKQFESAFNTVMEFWPTPEAEKKGQYPTTWRDNRKLAALDAIVKNLNTDEREPSLSLISKIISQVDLIGIKDASYFRDMKTPVYNDIAVKLIELGEYQQSLKIINKQVENDNKLSTAADFILAFIKTNHDINEDWEDFILHVSQLSSTN